MKILHLAESYHPNIGGGEVFIQHLTGALQARGFENRIITNSIFGSPQRESIQGIDIVRLPFRDVLLEKNIVGMLGLKKQLLGLSNEFSADFIHLHTYFSTAFYYLQIKDAFRVPTVFTTHIPIQANQMDMLAKVVHAVDWVAAVSTSMKDELLVHFPEVEKRTQVIHNSLPAPLEAPAALESINPTFLFLGRLVPEKGAREFLAALALVLKQYPHVKAILAGDGSDRAELVRLSVLLNISASVEFLGWVQPEAVYQLINKASVLVVPSHYEPFGLVALQAMQMARPVIASNVGGLPEMVVDGENGLLLPAADSNALAQAMIKLITNPVLMSRLGQNGYQKANLNFLWENCVTDYIDIYQRGKK